MKALVLSPAAEADLDDIWDYSAVHWGPDQADRYIDEIRDACRALALRAKWGRAVEVRPGHLKLATGSHMIYFRESDDMIDVVRVLHVRQDTERHL